MSLNTAKEGSALSHSPHFKALLTCMSGFVRSSGWREWGGGGVGSSCPMLL